MGCTQREAWNVSSLIGGINGGKLRAEGSDPVSSCPQACTDTVHLQTHPWPPGQIPVCENSDLFLGMYSDQCI